MWTSICRKRGSGVAPGVRFTGKERDAESGLDYFGARCYSAAQSRFTSLGEYKEGIVDPFTGLDIETVGLQIDSSTIPASSATPPKLCRGQARN
jgi:RHS repeat-associated protein